MPVTLTAVTVDQHAVTCDAFDGDLDGDRLLLFTDRDDGDDIDGARLGGGSLFCNCLIAGFTGSGGSDGIDLFFCLLTADSAGAADRDDDDGGDRLLGGGIIFVFSFSFSVFSLCTDDGARLGGSFPFCLFTGGDGGDGIDLFCLLTADSAGTADRDDDDGDRLVGLGPGGDVIAVVTVVFFSFIFSFSAVFTVFSLCTDDGDRLGDGILFVLSLRTDRDGIDGDRLELVGGFGLLGGSTGTDLALGWRWQPRPRPLPRPWPRPSASAAGTVAAGVSVTTSSSISPKQPVIIRSMISPSISACNVKSVCLDNLDSSIAV